MQSSPGTALAPSSPTTLRTGEMSVFLSGGQGRPRPSQAEVLQNAVGVELRTHPSPESGSLSLSRKVWHWSQGQGGVGCSGAQLTQAHISACHFQAQA